MRHTLFLLQVIFHNFDIYNMCYHEHPEQKQRARTKRISNLVLKAYISLYEVYLSLYEVYLCTTPFPLGFSRLWLTMPLH